MYQALKTCISVTALLFTTNLLAMSANDLCNSNSPSSTDCNGKPQGAQCYLGTDGYYAKDTFVYRDKKGDFVTGPAWVRTCNAVSNKNCYCGFSPKQKASLPDAADKSRQKPSGCVGCKTPNCIMSGTQACCEDGVLKAHRCDASSG